MKKYHSETPLHQVDSFGCEGGCYEVYKCEEVDAAFAEMRREHDEIIGILGNRISRLVEEIVRLRKQAGRYERLKPLISGKEYRRIGINYSEPRQIDALVDQLPASGEPKKQPRGKPCTCDNSLGSSVPCRVETGGTLGELWYCQKQANRTE